MREAIVLAGGFGTRLRAVVPDLPKPMAPVAGRPFLEILLTSLAAKGFQRVVLSLGFLADTVVQHFGGSYAGMELDYEIETTPLGTGGAIRAALGRCKAPAVCVLNGDTYLDLEADALWSLWAQRGEPVIVARHVDDTARYGRLQVDDGRVRRFAEKGEAGPGLINAGCYLLPRTILDAFPLGQAFSFETEFLAQAVAQRDISVFVSEGHFIDIGIPEDYARAQTELVGVCA
jgi:D-glycero-alpha-D-manno-heptose 1-phosphate guanylyltransferase